jgi:hypothetical protein
MKCAQTGIAREAVLLDWVKVAHAQWIMSNGAIITTPHNFKNPYRWYYRM